MPLTDPNAPEPELTYQGSVSTQIDTDTGTIIQEYTTTLAQEVHRWVTNTRELQTRDALINLGWTPPPPNKPAPPTIDVPADPQ